MRPYHILLIHFISDGHLGKFPLFCLLWTVAINILTHIFWWTYVWIPIGHISSYGIAGSQGLGISTYFSHSALLWLSISLMTNEVEHLFLCLMTIQIFSFVRCLFKSSAHLSVPFSYWFIQVLVETFLFARFGDL